MDQQDEPRADAIHVAVQTGTGPGDGSSARKSQKPKRFECTHPGCNKRFTRMEHMQRHSLNHNPGDSACPRCSATFKRPDLLERHMSRHRQKDLEAGGPGYGTLDTRKRSWKAPDGSVVQKRPRLDAEPRRPWATSGLEASTQVVSPPVSDEGRSGQHYQLAGDDDGYFDGAFHAVESSVSEPRGSILEQYSLPEFDCGFQPLLPTPRPQLSTNDARFEYQPAFQPDTASSFNMPYTTALDYNWLFNLEAATASGFGLTSAGPVAQEQTTYNTQDIPKSPRSTMVSTKTAQNPTPESRDDSSWRPWPEPTIDDSPRREDNHSHDMASSSIQSNINQSRTHTSTSDKYTTVAATQTTAKRGNHITRNGSVGSERSNVNRNTHTPLTSTRQAKPHVPERPLSMLNIPGELPQLDHAVRERLLAVIEAASPSVPDQSVEGPIRDHPLLSLNSLQSWLDLYFTQFNTAYPLIHLPTFDPGQVELLLLLSILLLGATYSDKSAHQLAVCIHDVIRPSIFAHAGFSPRPELWTLQTILLVECFGKSRAGQKQHDMSHLFHGLLINLIRRSDCQSVHAVLFCQSLCMSAFELRCSMPCSQGLWEAPDAGAWAGVWQQSPSSLASSRQAVPMFLPMLKSYLTPAPGGSASHRDGPDALGLVLVLHGLMSLAWDMQRRDQTSLGVNQIIGTSSWKDLMTKAYDRWKADFDVYCQDATAASAESGDDTMAAEWSDFATAYGTIYHSAQALLYMDFLDIQIYAGARHILGRPVQQQDYVRSSRVVKRWASSTRERAATAAWHSARMLRDLMAPHRTAQGASTGSRLADAMHSSLFHVPWCLYLATLVCWAFHHAKQGRKHLDEDDDAVDADNDESEDEIVWDSQRETESLIVGMAGSGKSGISMRDMLACQGRRSSNGLVWVIADVLSKVRWGIVHAGVVVLRGLVPMRLINQYETI
ncbi:hypothetical protein VPNG_07236 [Cytospora leucostoma]|uniref:C2H2-type domain-containing protein n=1 Tax=Cytospora leucostoma TaxID=1230097 RepID=A0A423WKB2_9PEZI|nr:hypothetical protein VPNG_07236 [Cytospora leucostoma]